MKIFLPFLAFLVFFLSLNKVFGQSCNGFPAGNVNPGNYLTTDPVCAPVTANWEIIYSKVTDGGVPANVSFEVEWGDNTNLTYPYVAGAYNPLVFNEVHQTAPNTYKAMLVHTYPNTGNVCSYEPRVYLNVNGERCLSSYQTQLVSSWNVEDQGTGVMLLDEQGTGLVVVPVCEGEPYSGTFQDNSTFNCNPTDFPDNPNVPDRYIQFVYGTFNNGTYAGRDRIPQVSAGGVPVTDAAGNLIGGVPLYSTPQNIPLLATASGLLTQLITFPAGVSTNGQVFEVTVRNWNYCNPYDDPDIPGLPVDLVNGDHLPVITTALVEIITTPPDLTGVTSDFCIGDVLSVTVSPYLVGGFINWYANLADVGDPAKIIYTGSAFNASTTPPVAYRLPNTVAGSRTYYVTEQLGNCESDPSPIAFTVRNALTTTGPVSCSKALNLCPGQTGITFSVPNTPPTQVYGGATEYVWSVPADWTITGGQGTRTITVTIGTTTGSQTVNVYLQYASLPRCPATAISGTKTVNALPGATIGPANLSYCSTQSGTNPDIDINGLTGQTPFTIIYEWNGGLNNKTLNSISANVNDDNPLPWPGTGTTTTYTLKSITDASGCITNAPHANLQGSSIVKVREALVTPPVLTGSASVCSGEQNVIYTLPSAAPNNPIGGLTRYRYQETNTSNTDTDWFTWNDGTTGYTDYETDTDQQIDVKSTVSLITRRLRVRLEYQTTVSSGSRCETGYSNKDITIYPLPDAVISGTSTICNGASATLTFTVTNGPVNIVYSDGTNSFNLNGVNSTTASTGALTANTTYTITSVTRASAPACGGTKSGSAIITVNALPTAGTDDPDATICQGDDFSFDIDVTGVAGGNFVLGYKINAGATIYTPEFDVNTYNLTILSASLTPGATNTISLVSITQQVGVVTPCDGTIVPGQVSIDVTVSRTPSNAAAGIDQLLCASLVSNPFDALAPAGAWEFGTWEKVSGPGAVTFLPNANTRTATANIAAGQEGVYEFQWIIQSGVCPVTRDTLEVDFGVSPTVDAGGPYDHCMPSLPALAASNSSGTGTWSKQAGLGNLTFTDADENDAMVTADMDGVYTVRWTVISGACAPVTDDASLTFWPLPVVTVQPDDDAVCETGNSTFSILPNDAGNYSYQWQKDEGTGFFNITDGVVYNGATTANLNITNVNVGMSGFEYRCVLTENAHTCPVISDEAILTVYPYPVIGDQPDNKSVCDGDNAFFAVGHNATTPGYQWQISTNGGGIWANLANNATYSGVDSDTLRISNIPFTFDTYQYRCIVTKSGLCSTTSAAALLTVYEYPGVTDEPDDEEICENDNTSFTIDATGGVLSFQWQIFNGTGYDDLTAVAPYSDVDQKTLVISSAPSTLNGKRYRCKITESGLCSSYTNFATLTVHEYPTVDVHPSNDETCVNGNASFSVTATGVTLTYKWQVDDGGGFIDIADGGIYSNSTTSTLHITGATLAEDGYKYRCRITESGLCPINSNQATLTVHAYPVIDNQPDDAEICNAQNTSFTIEASTVAPGYQWQADDGGGFVDLTDGGIYSNTNGTSLVLTAATTAYDGYKYRCIVTESGLCDKISDEATLTVHPYPVISTHPVDDETCTSSNAMFFVEAAGPNLSYQWEYHNGGGWANVPVDGIHSGVSNDTLLLSNVTDAMNGYLYRCRISESGLCQITSNQAELIIYQFPAITQATDDETCDGGNAAYVIAAPGATFQWQIKNGAIWDNLSNTGVYSGVTSNSLSLNGVDLTYNNNQYRCMVTQSGLCQTPTNPYLLTVHKLPTITDHPGSPAVCDGADATISISPNNATEYTYQWQVNKNDGFGFLNVPDNATYDNVLTASLKVNDATLSMNGYQYRCRIDSTDTGCSSISNPGVLTVHPIPVVDVPADIFRCANTLTTIPAFETDQDPVDQFRWFNNNTAVYTIGSSDIGNMSAFTTPANNTTGITTSGIQVVAEKNSCVSDTVFFTINVYPSPVVTQFNDSAFCPGLLINMPDFTSSLAGTTFYWTNSNTAIGTLASNGVNQLPNFTSGANLTGVSKTSTITVYDTSAVGCGATAMQFDLSLKPKPLINTINDTSLCAQINVSLPVFAANTAAPTSFSWSESGSIGLAPTTGSTNQVPVFTSVANNTVNNIEGIFTVTATKDGCASSVETFSLFVLPTPQMTAIDDINSCPGDVINVPDFSANTGGGEIFDWTHDNATIGLASLSGNGNIANFNAAANTSGSDVAANFQVTATKNGCTSLPEGFSVTIYPTPSVIQKDSIVVCPGDPINPGVFASDPAGSSFTWTNDNVNIGLNASGSDNIDSYNASNITTDSITANISVIGELSTCPSPAMEFTIVIKPKPVISPITPDVVVCPEDMVTVQAFSSVPSGSVFSWTNSNTANGLVASGTNSIASYDAPDNTTGAYINGNVTVTANLNGCLSNSDAFLIRIKPTPGTSAITGQFNVCATSDPANPTTKLYRVDPPNGTPGNTYNWSVTASNPVADEPVFTSFNNSYVGDFSMGTWTGTIQVVETSVEGCVGLPSTAIVRAYEIPVVEAGSDVSICEGETVVLGGAPTATGGSGNYSYSWIPTLGLNDATIANPQASPTSGSNYILQATDLSSLCQSLTDNVSVEVNPQPDPPAAASQSVCFGEPVPDLIATGTNVRWYGDAGLTNLLSVDNPFSTGETAVGVYTFYVTQSALGCESEARQVTLTIYSIPAAPASNNEEVCQGQPVPDLYATGSNVQWFSDMGLSVLVKSGNLFTTNKTLPGVYNYWVTQTVNNCQSPATPVTLTIFAKPAQPVSSDKTVCYGLEVPALVAQGTDIKWYDDIFLITPIAVNDTLITGQTEPGTYIYYVTQEENGCTSPTLQVKLIIRPVPEILLASATNETVCNSGDGTVKIIASGQSPLTYSIDGGTSFAASGNFSGLGNGNYPVVVKNGYGCLTAGDTLEVTNGDAPFAPPAGTSRTYCDGAALVNLTATAVSGGVLNWYTDAGLTVSLGNSSVFAPFNTIGTTTYYVTETQGGCESQSTNIVITINPIPPTPEISDTAVCTGETVPVLSASGSNVIWYSDAGLSTAVYAGNFYNTGQTAVNSYTYYLTQTENNCTSPASSVTLTIHQSPPVPDADNEVSCYGFPVPDLEATGSGVYWYSNSALTQLVYDGNVFPTGNVDAGTYTYYVIQSNLNCRSASRTVTQTIYSIPAKPVAPDKTICFGEPSPLLTSTGSFVRWYTSSPPGVPVYTGNSYNHGIVAPGTYPFYVTQTVNGCESPADTCVFIIHPKPDKPVAPDVTACFGQTIPDLTAAGQNLKWYYGITQVGTGSPFASGRTIVGTFIYNVTQTINNCTSDPEEVNLVINPSPSITNIDFMDQTVCNSNDGQISITATGTMPLDYSIDDTLTWQNSGAFTGLKNGMYPTSVRNAYGCIVWSDTVTINDGSAPDAPVAERDTVYCSDETIEAIVAYPTGPAQITWFRNFALTDTIAIANSIVPDSYIGTKHYFAVQSVGVCESPASQVTIVINQQPDPPVSGDTALCFGLPVPDLSAIGENVQWFNHPSLALNLHTGNTYATGKTDPGSYVYYVTQTQNNCRSMPTKDTLTIHALPDIDFAVGPGEGCSPLNVELINTSDSVDFLWNFGDGTIDSVYSPADHLYLNASGSLKYYSIKLTGTNENACVKNLTRYVTVYPLKNFDFIVIPDSACHPASMDIVSAPGAEEYDWNFGNGQTYTGPDNNPTRSFSNLSNTSDTTYQITLRITTQAGCIADYAHPVTVHPQPVASFTVNPASGGTPFTPAIANNSSGAATYSWNFGDNTALSIDENPAHTWENPGTSPLNLTVSLTITNAGGCSHSSSQAITVFPIPPPPVCANQFSCEEQPTPDLVASGESGAFFRWYDSDALLLPLQEGDNVFPTGQTLPGEYHYWVTQEKFGVVSLATEVTLTIYPKPEPPVLTDTAICFGQARPYLIATGENMKWYKNFTLTTLLAQGDSLYPPDSLPRLNAYLYYATQEENGCTSNYATQRFYINPLPVIISATAQDQAYCNSGDGRIVINAQNVNSPLYYSIDGGLNFYPSDYSTNQGLKTFTLLGSGNYPVVVQNKFECNFYGDTLRVSAGDAPPAPDAGDDAVYCYGDVVADLWAESNPAGDTLIWYSDVLLQNQVGFGTSFEPFVYEDTTIIYYVHSVKGGCPSPVSSVTVTIYGIPYPPVVRDTAICFGQDAPVLFVQGQNLEWFADPGLTIAISDQQPEDLSVGVHKYYIRQIVNGCISGASELTFTVYQTPPKPIADNTSACFNNSDDLLTATGTTGTIYWSGNRLFSDTLNIGTEFYTGNFDPGQITYYLLEEYVENGHVCRSAYDTATQTIRALPPAPNHYFFNDSVICSNEPKPTFMAEGSSTSSTYRWFFSANPALTLASTKNYKPEASLGTGVYYYSLTQTLNGCTSLPDTLVFTIRQQPQPPVAPDVSACFGQEIPPLTAIGLGIEWTDGDTLASGNTFYSGETAEGTHFYFVSQTVEECTSLSESVLLTIHNSPEITDVDTTPQSGCNMNDGEIYIHIVPALNSDSIRYSVDNGNNFQTSALFDSLRNGLYPTYVVNRWNCFDRGDTAKISDITTVPAPFAERDTVYCSYETREYLVATALSGIDSLIWYRNNFDDTLLVSDQVMPDLILGETSYYVVQVSEGCESDPTELKVTINPQPQAPITKDTALCVGLTVPDLTALGFNILWYSDTTSSSIVSGNIFDPPAINAGQYIYFATQTIDACESPAAPDTLIIHPKPDINFSVAPVDSCSPMPVRISNLSVADTCTWLFHDDTIVGYNPPIHTYYNTSNNTRTFQITLQAETQYGCTKSGSKEVHVFPVKDYNFTASPEFICSGQTVQFFSPQGAYPYYWNFGDGTDAIEAGNNVIHTFFNSTSTTQVYTVTMQAKTSFGCLTPVYQKDITVYPKPIANFDMDTLAGCTPFSPSITNLSVGASHWVWKLDGVPVSTLENMDSAFENLYNSPLYYNLSLSVSNDDGCISEPYAQIFTVFPEVNASIGVFGDTTGCGTLPVRFSNLGNGSIWHWEFGQGLPSDNFTPPEHVFTNDSDTISVFEVTLHSISQHGCFDRDTMQVVVYPLPEVRLDVDKFNFCSPDTVTCTNLSDPDLDYTWKFGDGTADFSTISMSPFTHPYSNSSQGLITRYLVLTGKTEHNCTAVDSIAITVYPNMNAAFSFNQTDSCGFRQVAFTDLSNLVTNMSYSWNFGDGFTSSDRNPVHPFVNSAHDTVADFVVNLTATWNNHCSDIFTDTVKVYPVPFASFTSDSYDGCSPLDIQTTNNSQGLPDDVFTWSFGDPSPDEQAMNVSHIYENQSLSNAFANLKLTATNLYGCSDDSVSVITIFPALSAGFNVSDTAGCHPLKVYFYNESSGPGSLSYNFGDGTPATTQANPVHTFNNLDFYVADTFEVVLQKANGICTDLATRRIIVFPSPKAEFLVSPSEGCPPFLAKFNTSTTEGRRDSCQWAFGDLEGSNNDSILVSHLYRNQNNPNPVNYLASFTTYNITGTYACPSVFSDTIRVYPEVKAGFLVDTGKCSGQNFHFTNASSGTTNFHWFDENYTWESSFTNPDKIFSNASQITDTLAIHLVAILPEYELCNDTVSKPIYIYPIPAVNYSLTDNSGCSPFTVECVNTTSSDLNFQWNFGSGFINQTNDTMNYIYNIGATQPSEKIIVLRGTSQFGCVGTTQQQITVYPEVTAQFTQDKTEGCSPLEIRFTNESTGFDSIAWDFDNGFFSQSQYPIETFRNTSVTDSAVYQVQLIAKTDWCADTAVVTVEVHPAPTVSFFVAPYEDCSPVTIHISDSSQGVSEYFWEFGDQQTSGDPGPDIIHTYPGPLLPTSYNLRLTGENDFGCQASQNQPIYVKPRVDASFVPTDTAGCSPLQVTFQNYSTGNNLTYSWTINNGVAITESSPTRSFVNNGFSDSTLFVQMVARSQYNCLDTASRLIRVYATPNANFTLIPETMLYPQTTVYLLQQTPDSDTITWNYAWNFGDNSSSNLREPQQHVYDTSGMFRVFLRVDGEHCWDSLSRILNITLPPPIAEFDSIPAGCAPHVVQFSNQSIYAHTYRWTFGDGSVSNSRQPEHTYWDAGLYQVKLNIIGPGGIDEQSRYVLVHPKPFARFDVAPEFIYVPEQPVKCFNQSENGDLFEWDFGDGSAIQTDTTPLHYYQQAGEYSIKMVVKTDTDPQCVDSVIREKAVLAENAGVINLPNAFRPSASGPNGGYYSPNGYNNHIFYPPVANSVIEYKLTIFNRWGQKIFETSDITQGWDGYFDGKQCSQDVYVWKVEGKYANKQAFVKMGDVTLIR